MQVWSANETTKLVRGSKPFQKNKQSTRKLSFPKGVGFPESTPSPKDFQKTSSYMLTNSDASAKASHKGSTELTYLISNLQADGTN